MRIEDLPPWAQAQAANQIMARQRRGSGRSRAPSPALSDDEEEMPRRAASKYHNRKAARITAAGNILEFDSQKEARRYDELALLLAAGLGFFLVKYFLDGGSWASSAFNRHLYNSSGQLASGTVLDRDGDVLSEVVDGQRTYYDNATVRKATLHAVGDLQGNIGTGALNAFADNADRVRAC